MQIKKSKSVRFSGETKFDTDPDSSEDQDCLLKFRIQDLKEWEKVNLITEKEFSQTCKQFIKCNTCCLELTSQFKNRLAKLQACPNKIDLLQSRQHKLKFKPCYHKRISQIFKVDQISDTSTLIFLQKIQLLDFPRLMKDLGEKIIIPADIFKQKVHLYLNNVAPQVEFYELKEIVKITSNLLSNHEIIGQNDFLQIHDQNVVIQYDYSLFEKILQLGTALEKGCFNRNTKFIKAICCIIFEQLFLQWEIQDKEHKYKVIFLELIKTYIIQSVQEKMSKIEDEKKQQMFFQSLENEEKIIEAKKVKLKQKREKKKLSRKLKKYKKAINNQSQNESFGEDDVQFSFENDLTDEDENYFEQEKIWNEIFHSIGSLTQFNKQRKQQREQIKRDWENYKKQFSKY